MLKTSHLRHLTLHEGTGPGRAPHLATASGLVVSGENLFVVADDELYLAVFPLHGQGKGSLTRLFPGELPGEYDARKARKPDLEAICKLPPFGPYEHGALLALGSGSTQNRFRAALIALDDAGNLEGAPLGMIPQALYTQLSAALGPLNIEGAAVSGEHLVLLQRGNGDGGKDRAVRVSLDKLLRGFAEKKATEAGAVVSVSELELGSIAGVRLSFTDASPLPDGRIGFSAAAEASPDTYRDGPCAGSAVGILGPDLRLQKIVQLDARLKIEGLHAEPDGSLLLVADADDAAVASPLLAASLPL